MPRFFELEDGTTIYQRRIPQWRREGATYFVTWRILRDQSELDPRERTIVFDAVQFFDKERYDLIAAVVMSDHAHAILWPYPGIELTDVLHSWKSFSVRTMQRNRWRSGSLWQEGAFNRILRGPTEFKKKTQYVAGNPRKRWPDLASYDWVFPHPRDELL
jgi:REP element-mobilizing transposase RayT